MFKLQGITNAREVLANGAKPIVSTIEVPMVVTVQAFDFELSEDKTEFTYKEFTTCNPLNEDGWDQEFVTINPALMYLFSLLGGEAAVESIGAVLAPGLANTSFAADRALAEQSADGTTAANIGLFVKISLRDYMMGYTDPLTGLFTLGAFDRDRTTSGTAYPN